jgi:hypothetical protein
MSLKRGKQPKHRTQHVREQRPFWTKFRELFPAPEATELADRVFPSVVELSNPRFGIQAVPDWDWVRADLVEVAAEFTRIRRWRELPEARYYRAHVKDIQRTTEQLLELIRNAPEDAIWELSLRASQDMGMPLRQTARTKDGARLPPVGFELSLMAFVSICKTITATGSKRAPRPREDLVCLALGLARLWSKLAQQRFPKTFAVMVNVPGMDNPQEPEFEKPGPQFVRQLMPAFDGSLQFAEIRTALKAVPVKALSIQQITGPEAQSLDHDPLAKEAEAPVDTTPRASPSPLRTTPNVGSPAVDRVARTKNTRRRLAGRDES